MRRLWTAVFRLNYRVVGWLDPLIRAIWRRRGLGNVVDLRVPGRRSGSERRALLGLLRVGDRLYLGHPNGEAGWTRNLRAAGTATLVLHGRPPLVVRAVPLGHGPEREAAILSTGQHPFPGDLLYRLGRGHVRRVGAFFRVEPIAVDEGGAA